MNDDSFLTDALQDPLLTLVALVLFGTLWLIIPGGRTAEDAVDVDSLNDALSLVEKSIHQLERDMGRTREQIQEEENRAQSIGQEFRKREVAAEDQLARQTQRANELANEVANQNETLEELQARMPESGALGEEAALLITLERRQRELEAQLTRAEQEAVQLRVEIGDMSSHDAELLSEQDLQMGMLMVDLRDTRRNVEFLKWQRNILESSQRTSSTGSAIYTTVSDRPAINIEAAGGRIWIMQPDNYRITRSVNGVAYHRRTDARGDDQFEVMEDGHLQVLLRSLSNDHVVVFWVRPDSFAVFLAARMVVETSGFNVGWHPHEGPLSFVIADRALIRKLP